MNNRAVTYFKRKKAFNEMLNPVSLKGLLKAAFYSSGNLLVKRDILKVYTQLEKPNNRMSA